MTTIVPGVSPPMGYKSEHKKMVRTSGENLKISTSDLEVNYDDNGPVYAPVVLFIHGTPFNKSIWDLQAEALKSNYRVIAYDLRGHGGTIVKEEKAFSIEQFSEDLVEFMDALQISKVILCGQDLGGHIALEAVDRYPERFQALALTGTHCAADSDEIISERTTLIKRLQENGIEKFAEEAMRNLFATTSFTTRKEEVRSVSRMMEGTLADTVIKTLQSLSDRRESCGNLWSIKLPVLLLAGKEDQVTTADQARFMRDNISGSTLHLIEYAGHLANIENTHEFNELLKHFIDKVSERKHLTRHRNGETRVEVR